MHVNDVMNIWEYASQKIFTSIARVMEVKDLSVSLAQQKAAETREHALL